MNGSQPLIEIRGVGLSFGGAEVLSDVSFEVRTGECVGLIGPNGAGKTSLLNCISRTYRSDQGVISFAGRDLATVPPHRIPGLGIARTFQSVQMLPGSTVLRNVVVGAHPRMRGTFVEGLFRVGRSSRDERRFEEEGLRVLEQLGLKDLAYQRVGDLPFGSQKLVEVARALIGRPRLLLLDEPIGGTNTEEREIIGSSIRRIQREYELSILVVEHDLTFVRAVADRIVALDFGKIVADGDPDAVLSHPQVIESYIGSSKTSPAAEQAFEVALGVADAEGTQERQ
jgi:branched-chain amino acid transport system ATP-binding protein